MGVLLPSVLFLTYANLPLALIPRQALMESVVLLPLQMRNVVVAYLVPAARLRGTVAARLHFAVFQLDAKSLSVLVPRTRRSLLL